MGYNNLIRRLLVAYKTTVTIPIWSLITKLYIVWIRSWHLYLVLRIERSTPILRMYTTLYKDKLQLSFSRNVLSFHNEKLFLQYRNDLYCFIFDLFVCQQIVFHCNLSMFSQQKLQNIKKMNSKNQ